jgi:glycosyltransferase involved in cell wall biosynthesis
VKVTAIIPTYNRRSHTLRAIECVLAQTTPADEIVVVDDGSTDGTAEAVAKRYGPRVLLIRQKNAGVSAARNRGIQAARGEWLAFLDSDDFWEPDKLEQQFAAIAAAGTPECGACFTDCIFDGNPEMTRSAFENAGLRSAGPFGVLDDAPGHVLSTRPVMFVQSLLVRRSIVQSLAGFDESMVVSEDTDLLFRLGLATRICFVAAPMVHIDRRLERGGGLCDMYASRDDRVFASATHFYTKLLAMPQVSGSRHEPTVRQLYRIALYDSIESKLHHMRVPASFHEAVRLRHLGESSISIVRTLLSRRLEKLHRKLRDRKRQERDRSSDNIEGSVKDESFARHRVGQAVGDE